MTGTTGGSPEPAGIYVHLPYCRSRCEYCAFVVTTDESSRTAYLEALEREADLAGAGSGGEPFDSIYLGGGTPSLLPPDDLARLLERLWDRFALAPGAEMTMEANPTTSPKISSAGGRRRDHAVLDGVQSLADAELAAVGRRHDADAARAAVGALTRTGLSVSADLILGAAGPDAGHFPRERRRARAFRRGSPLDLSARDGEVPVDRGRPAEPPGAVSVGRRPGGRLDGTVGASFPRRGSSTTRSRTGPGPAGRPVTTGNTGAGVPTIGLGVSSHEFWAGRRRANVSALPAYFASLGRGQRPTALDRALPGTSTRGKPSSSVCG